MTADVPCGAGYGDRQMLMIVQGEAGTGKSRIIKCWQNDPDFHKHGLVVAPTGIAAAPCGGRTFHSAFKTPVGTSSNCRRHIDCSSMSCCRVSATRSFHNGSQYVHGTHSVRPNSASSRSDTNIFGSWGSRNAAWADRSICITSARTCSRSRAIRDRLEECMCSC